jgi:peptidoglycan hydrolase-like protein with peptidoglycan-binding domain
VVRFDSRIRTPPSTPSLDGAAQTGPAAPLGRAPSIPAPTTPPEAAPRGELGLVGELPRYWSVVPGAQVGALPRAIAAVVLGGVGGAIAIGAAGHNAKADVERVQQRLKDLGFPVTVDGDYGNETLRNIRLFAAIVGGVDDVSSAPSRITPGGAIHRALASEEAPRWVAIPSGGPGWINADTDGFSYGTDRMVAVLTDSAATYQSEYRSAHPGATRIATNDASRARGGDAPGHESHEAGLDLDLRLPRKDGTHGAKVSWAAYDREATYAQIVAFAKDPRVERILFSDTVLLNRIQALPAAANPWKSKVQWGGNGHKDHIHVDISAPTID